MALSALAAPSLTASPAALAASDAASPAWLAADDSCSPVLGSDVTSAAEPDDGAGAGAGAGSGVGAGAGASVPAEPPIGALASSASEHAASRLMEATIAITAKCVRVFFIFTSLIQRRVYSVLLMPVRLAVQQRACYNWLENHSSHRSAKTSRPSVNTNFNYFIFIIGFFPASLTAQVLASSGLKYSPEHTDTKSAALFVFAYSMRNAGTPQFGAL